VPVPRPRDVAAIAVLAASACHHGSSGAAGIADAQADARGDASTVPALTVDRKTYPRVQNPTGPDGTLFFTGSGEGCHIAKAPHPEQVPDLNAAETVPCPDALRDPAWNACAGGTMFSSMDQKKCLCASGGSAPQATVVPCPVVAK